MNLTIAMIQKKSTLNEVAKNTQMAIESLQEAKRLGADLVVFPECFLSGYGFPIQKEMVLTAQSEYIQMICKMAQRCFIGVVLTCFTEGENGPRNTAFLIDRNGKIQLQYDKVHTCDFADETVLEHGEMFHVCQFDGISIGIMICYDREYPESARELMLKGAEIIVVPNDCTSMQPRCRALSTRAYENMCAVVMANVPGENAGCSCAYSPICWDQEGACIENEMAMANEEEDVLLTTFDMDQIRAYREREMMGNTFRKCSAYQHLLSTTITYPFQR